MESSLRDSAPEGVRVLETLRYDPRDSRDDSQGGCVRMALHVARAERTCAALGFAFDRVELVRILNGSKGGGVPAIAGVYRRGWDCVRKTAVYRGRGLAVWSIGGAGVFGRPVVAGENNPACVV